ncbi:uncharacterized protein LOC111303589 [Durio zibethinus]|uniref:Uncharacterized protein LOC111303589 n=1 Tax=Durio zibethinus TaxID=66656 RepID=A0A6P5ZTB8_DURZI|nr:uncharacterized protein LOC111303589 [Durio zibethinus]
MGFFDLNIPYTDSTPPNNVNSSASAKSTRIKIVIKAMELGYTGIAYNRTIRGVMSDRDRCSISLLTLSSLLNIAPFLSSSVKLHRDLLGVPRSSPFRQYTRLTVCIDTASQSQALNSGNPVLKTYDVVAVRPLNQNAFDQACEKAEVDIIAIDFSDKLPFRLKLHMVKTAIKRGVYFEITYSDLIVDVHLRRQMISNAKLLVDWTRGKNLIFSSAAPSVCEVRGPNDVANLATLLGLSIERAKAAISKNCRSLLASALRRKHFFKEVIRVEAVSSSVPFDSWKPWSADWLNWDLISSGEGDLLLDDMAKSFSSSSNVSNTVKAIDFDSVIDNMPSHGFQVKGLISGTKAASHSLAKVKNILSTTEPVQLPIITNQVSEKSGKLDFPETEKASLDGTPSEHLTSLFGDSQKLYLTTDGTKISTDSEEVVTNTTTTKEEPETHNGLDIIFASVENESESLDLQSENCFPDYEKNVMLLNENVRIEASSNELNVVMPNENVTSQTSTMDIEPDAGCNAAALEISPPSKDNILPPAQNKDSKSSKGSRIDSREETIKVDDVAVGMHIDVEHQDNMSLSLTNVSLLENFSERIPFRGTGEDAVITDQISFQQSDEGVNVKDIPLVTNHENQVELVKEERKNAESDVKMNDPASVLSDESLHENVLEREPTTVPGDDGGLVGWNPFPESNAEMKGKDIPSTITNEIQEPALERQKHGEHDRKNNDLSLGQRITGKLRTRWRNPRLALLFPLRRYLYPVSFKRKAAKKSERRMKMA